MEKNILKGKLIIVKDPKSMLREIMILCDIIYATMSAGSMIPVAICLRKDGTLYFSPAERITILDTDNESNIILERYRELAFEMVPLEEFKEGTFENPAKMEGAYYLEDRTTKAEDVTMVGIRYDYFEIGRYYVQGTVKGQVVKIPCGNLYRLKDGWRAL